MLVPDVGSADDGYAKISAERLGDLAGDALVIGVTRGDAEYEAVLTEIQASPLYATLPAVRGGRVVVLDSQPWFGQAGLRGYRSTLAELQRFFR